MTIFGKAVMGMLMLVIGGGIFYGVTTYVKEDGASGVENTPVTQQVETTFPQDNASTSEMTNGTSTNTSSTTDTKPSGKKMAFTEFMKQGGSYKCDVTQTVANMTTSGKVFMHDALVRAEFSTSVAGQSLNTTMIARDGYMYSWTSMTPNKGYKTKISQSGDTGTANPSATYTWNGSQVGDYTCEVWKADDALFEIPKTVTFTLQ